MKAKRNLTVSGDTLFARLMSDYLEQNRAIGNKYNVDAVYLEQFNKLCIERGLETPVFSEDIWSEWCGRRPHETESSQQIRIRTLRKFLVFLSNHGVDAPKSFHPLPHISKTFVPYIFTRDEIRRLLTAVDKNTAVSNHSPAVHLIMPLLFRILYCCGLRISEALSLKNENIYLESGYFILQGAKGGKDRLVPMADSLTSLCKNYRNENIIKNYASEYFFPSTDGLRWSECTIYTRFREYLFAAGIEHHGRGKGPRLHDLRHTFAVHTLENWAVAGKDIYVCLPRLSTYLGHKNIFATQQYLRLTSEAYGILTNAFETSFPGIFPEVRDE